MGNSPLIILVWSEGKRWFVFKDTWLFHSENMGLRLNVIHVWCALNHLRLSGEKLLLLLATYSTSFTDDILSDYSSLQK